MSQLRILLANEPRAYREALAAVCRILRPDTEVCAVCSEELCDTVRSFCPHLVVCSRVTDSVEEWSLAWIELYPDYGHTSRVSLDGRRSTVEGIQLDDILHILDATGDLTRTTQPGG
jgi:hypothetical protein